MKEICWFHFVTILFLPCLARPSDVTVYSVTKGIYAEQTNPGAATVLTNNGYVFEANVFLSATGTVQNASVQAPGGAGQPLPLDDPQQFQLRDKYNTRAKLDSHYPNGGFFVTKSTVPDGTRVVGLAILNDVYPNIPHVNNFSEDPGGNANIYFTLGWDGMNGGTSSDYIQLRIEDSAGDKVFETPDFGKPGALNGIVTTVMMTPGTLEAGHVYSATLRF